MFQSRACAVLKSRVSLSWRRKTKVALPWQRTTAITCTPARAAFSDGSPPLCAIPPAPGTTLILSQNYRVKRTTGTESGGKNSAQSAARDVVSLVYLCVIMVVGYRKQKTTLFLSDIAKFRKILSTNWHARKHFKYSGESTKLYLRMFDNLIFGCSYLFHTYKI